MDECRTPLGYVEIATVVAAFLICIIYGLTVLSSTDKELTAYCEDNQIAPENCTFNSVGSYDFAPCDAVRQLGNWLLGYGYVCERGE